MTGALVVAGAYAEISVERDGTRITAMDTGWVVVAIFLAVLTLLAVTVARGLWRLVRGEYEAEAGGSWARQLFGRRSR
jgi:hypothetical protein